VFDPDPTRRTELACAAAAFLGTVGSVSELQIRAVDHRDDADMDAFQDVYAAAELAEDPAVRLYSREDAIAMLTSPDTSGFFDAFGAYVDGQMVGESILMGGTRHSLEVAQLLLWVDPARQRQGYGARLLAHIEEHARRSRGRTVLRVQARVGAGLERNRVFAEAHGYTAALTEIERRLPLPVDPALLDRLEAESAPHHRDYEIRPYEGRVPDGLRASYIDLANLLEVEMPHGDLALEARADTVDDLEALEKEREAAGRATVGALAVRDGVVVAYANATVPGGDARHVDQYGTLVHPDHRGHRLGMAVKCAQLRLLGERFPDRDHIGTSNAETNAHMVAINETLGFAVHQVWCEFEKRLG
jgi:GNAT superfamily N-acetyltransferase